MDWTGASTKPVECWTNSERKPSVRMYLRSISQLSILDQATSTPGEKRYGRPMKSIPVPWYSLRSTLFGTECGPIRSITKLSARSVSFDGHVGRYFDSPEEL